MQICHKGLTFPFAVPLLHQDRTARSTNAACPWRYRAAGTAQCPQPGCSWHAPLVTSQPELRSSAGRLSRKAGRTLKALLHTKKSEQRVTSITRPSGGVAAGATAVAGQGTGPTAPSVPERWDRAGTERAEGPCVVCVMCGWPREG